MIRLLHFLIGFSAQFCSGVLAHAQVVTHTSEVETKILRIKLRVFDGCYDTIRDSQGRTIYDELCFRSSQGETGVEDRLYLPHKGTRTCFLVDEFRFENDGVLLTLNEGRQKVVRLTLNEIDKSLHYRRIGSAEIDQIQFTLGERNHDDTVDLLDSEKNRACHHCREEN